MASSSLQNNKSWLQRMRSDVFKAEFCDIRMGLLKLQYVSTSLDLV